MIRPNPIRVLIIDDDAQDRRRLIDVLTRTDGDFEAEAVADAAAARPLVTHRGFDAFLVNGRLPDESGVDLITELASSASGPMIVIADVSDTATDHAGLAAGAFDYIPKSETTPEVLKRTIRYAVRAWIERRHYQEMLDQTPVGLFRTDPSGEITQANPALAAVVGYAHPSELVGRSAADFYVDPSERADVLRELRAGVTALEKRVQLRRVTGEAVWCEIRYQPIFEDGQLVELYGTVRDIDATVHRQQRLQVQAALLEQAHHAAIATDPNGLVTFWNRRAERLFGWTSAEVIGRPLLSLELALAPAVVTRSPDSGPWEEECWCRTRDGTIFPAIVTSGPVVDDLGEPGGQVMSVVDLTDVRAALDLADARQALAESLLDSITSPTAVVDATGTIVAVNSAWNRFAIDNGGDPAAVGVGSDYLAVCDTASEPEAAEMGRALRAVLAGDRPSFSLEYQCDSPSEERWFRAEVFPTDFPEGGAVLLHLDITALRAATRNAQELSASKTRLIASVSHELRTPLTAIVGFAEMLTTATLTPDERREFVEQILYQAVDMAAIIEDLLVAARVEIGTVTIVPAEIDLSQTARSTCSRLLEKQGKTLTLPETSVIAYADPVRTRQIIRNLVSNAVRYGGEHITVDASNGGPYARLTVTDDGPGVPTDKLDTIFEPFQTGDLAVGRTDSLGLGLFVSRQLARMMGGDLRHVVGSEKVVTTFELTLPSPGNGATRDR